MTEPRPALKRWNPLGITLTERAAPTTVTFENEPPGTALLVDLDAGMELQRNVATLHRAAKVNGLLDSLFEPNPSCEGQPWYDRLGRIVAMHTEATIDGERMCFAWAEDAGSDEDELYTKLAALASAETDGGEPATHEICEHAVAERIVVRILVRREDDTQVQLQTDFAVGSESATWLDEGGIIVARDSPLDVETLKNLIAEAIFEHDWDANESKETQFRKFMDEAHNVAARLLLGEHEAAAEVIRQAVATHAWHLLPDDRSVRIRKKPLGPDGHADVEVAILRD